MNLHRFEMVDPVSPRGNDLPPSETIRRALLESGKCPDLRIFQCLESTCKTDPARSYLSSVTFPVSIRPRVSSRTR